MKLIRLTTDKVDGSFECNFKTDITINENSKIALKSASFTTKNILFTIDATNDLVFWSWTQSGNPTNTFDMEFDLTHASYTEDTINDFLKDFQLKLNNALSITGTTYNSKMVGLQWEIVNSNGYLNISYLASPFSFNQGFATLTDIGYFANTETLAKSTAGATDDKARIIWNKPFTKGAGVHQISITSMTDSTTPDTGFFIGITRTKIDKLDPTNISQLHKDTYIYIDGNELIGGGFPISYGNLDASGANPQLTLSAITHDGNADTIQISRENGKIQMGIYRDGGAFNYTKLFEMNDNGTTDFYPYIIMRGDSGDLTLGQPRTQLDPYKLGSINNNEDLSITLTAPPLATPNLTGTNQILFNNTLEELLGFTNNDLSDTDGRDNAVFIASNTFDFGLFNDTYLVLLDNIRLESYDGYDGVERNILHTINVSDNNTNRVVQYETNTLDYIELRNIKKLNIRNIKGRIVKTDLQPVVLNGITSLVLLVD